MSIDFNRKEGDGELWIGKVDFTPTAFDAGELLADTATAPVIVGPRRAGSNFHSGTRCRPSTNSTPPDSTSSC